MTRSLRFLALGLPLLFSSAAYARDLPNFDAYQEAPEAQAITAAAQGAPSATASARDEKRGVPTFLWVARSAAGAPHPFASLTPEAAAVAQLEAQAPRYGLSKAALATARVVRTAPMTGGAKLVVMRQSVGGTELYRSDMKLLLDAHNELVAIGGNLHAAATSAPKGPGFAASPELSIARALTDLYAMPIASGEIENKKRPRAGYHYFDLKPFATAKATGLSFEAPARARRVYFPLPDRIVPAYFIELLTQTPSAGQDAHAYVVAADDGRILYRENRMHAASFDYRVWADPAGDKRPSDSPLADFSPHPTGTPDGSYPLPVAPVLVSMDGFNTNPNATFDPWLPLGATETLGNNVDAYTDDGSPDGFSGGDLRAATSSAGVFDYLYDLNADPQSSATQRMASVTQIFYVTNWLHDWWYDSGFNEAAGNAQSDNFGRGGVEGDPLLAEAQDNAPSSRNNANMSAMGDGQSPRMQMYVWDGRSSNGLTVQPLNQTYAIGNAAFGPTSFNTTGQVVLVNDGSGTVTDACQPITNSVAGKIALLDRANCSFKQKAVYAEAAGAIGVILADNIVAGAPPPMGNGNPTATPVNIPVVSITLADGDAIKLALGGGAVTATLTTQPAVDLDGTIDNSIVAHEWGHYIHLRLVNCGSQLCGAESEGWGDYLALHMAVRPGDDLDGAFGVSQYAVGGYPNDPGYFGIRRYPYSVDFAKDPLTFKHIQQGTALPVGAPVAAGGSNSEVHNAGEIWATMLWEATVALLKQSQGANPPYTFEGARRRIGDYLVVGMQLAPIDPTYLEQRDGILAAAAATDTADMTLIAQAFATRGAGSCAVSPPKNSTNFQGVVESFTLAPTADIVAISVDDSVASCDQDGYLDALETGRVNVQVKNSGPVALTMGTVTIATTTPGVTFLGATTIPLGMIDPYQTVTVGVDAQIDPAATAAQTIDLTATVDAPEACVTSSQLTVLALTNADEVLASSANDDVEASQSAWTLTGMVASEVWSIVEPSPAQHAWRGIDYPSPSDTQLVSPPLDVSANSSFILSFSHRYKFEFGQNTYWDGGVIEVSTDAGQTWVDVSTLVAPAYDGTLGDPQNQAQNVLKGQMGYADQSPLWPAANVETLDFGSAFAGQTIQVRFRIGTDDAVGDFGWEIDDIDFQGITNTPFASVIDDAAACLPPVADAGPDQTVDAGTVVTIDASGSSDPDSPTLAFAWTEVTAFGTALADPASSVTTFTAPAVDGSAVLTFQVAVSDGVSSAVDTVDITVVPALTSSTGVGGGDATSTTTTTAASGATATTGAGGESAVGAGGAAPLEPIETGGCGCVVAGGSEREGDPGGTLPSVIAAAALAALGRRRRARR